MRSPSMPSLFASASSNAPKKSLHRKSHDEIPRRSKTDTMTAVAQAFSATRTLHQVLGMREPEPFVTPPAMPSDLAARFDAGLQKYGWFNTGVVPTAERIESRMSSLSSQPGKTSLADISEGEESPVRAAPVSHTANRAGGGLGSKVLKRTSGKQAVTAAQRHTSFESGSDTANDAASDHTGNECGDGRDSLTNFGSTTSLAVSEGSKPSSAARQKDVQQVAKTEKDGVSAAISSLAWYRAGYPRTESCWWWYRPEQRLGVVASAPDYDPGTVSNDKRWIKKAPFIFNRSERLRTTQVSAYSSR
ncbi:hypothetical protein OPT61_g3330 [Boeremia exigua]|uniref:Uncharacterized protein n=1 Tax=Boeremia exigua TaxID=749465 RepID=A0ACC2II71_9PLEO|nr:hypothetical protein OPT61_g3330 [Boeremia exigua]